jgi:predicted amidophosphoribosyltransferase
MPRSADRASHLWTGWRTGLHQLERWLLPSACLLCGEATPASVQDPLICPICRSRWRSVPAPCCERCGQPIVAGLECRICAGWPPSLARVRSAVWLEGTAQDAVHLLKYAGWWRVAEGMAPAMAPLEPLTGQVCLIPIPLGARRLRERGYNQSERIAAALGALIGLPVRSDLLSRVRETATQTALTPEARQANLAGAFRSEAAQGLHLVLVDDVFTTGATLCAAAVALHAAGAEWVEAVTFARAKVPVG